MECCCDAFKFLFFSNKLPKDSNTSFTPLEKRPPDERQARIYDIVGAQKLRLVFKESLHVTIAFGYDDVADQRSGLNQGR